MSTFLKILLEKTADSERFRGTFYEKLDSLFAPFKNANHLTTIWRLRTPQNTDFRVNNSESVG